MDMMDMRPQRALQIATQKGQIKDINANTYEVKSQSGNGSYFVSKIGEDWRCTCPDFTERQTPCKHIYAVSFAQSLKANLSQNNVTVQKQVLEQDVAGEVEKPESCIYCGSQSVVKRGFAYEKRVKKVQRFWCKCCGKTFVVDIGFKKMKNDPKVITAALDSFFKGLSLNDVKDHLSQFYGVDVNETTILRWISKYTNVISEYVNTLAPQLSDTWHADEVFQKMRGGVKYKGDAGMAFLWNIMDRKTRFLLASKLSERRDREGAIAAFNEAVKNAHDSQPEKVYTDSLRSYREAIAVGGFCPSTPEHIARCGIMKPHANNNRIERMNGTQRERFKVQRGWKSMQSAIPEGNRIFYNYLRPHMALEGQTPAQVAGINLKLDGKGNRWMELIKLATVHAQQTQ